METKGLGSDLTGEEWRGSLSSHTGGGASVGRAPLFGGVSSLLRFSN